MRESELAFIPSGTGEGAREESSAKKLVASSIASSMAEEAEGCWSGRGRSRGSNQEAEGFEIDAEESGPEGWRRPAGP